MKKYLTRIIAFFSYMTMLFTLNACSNDMGDNPAINPEPGSEQLPDVAVLFYGHGGGNLDVNMIGNIREFYYAEPSVYNNVAVAVEYKFSSKNDIPHNEVAEWEEEFESVDDVIIPDTTTTYDSDYIKLMNPKGYSTFRFVVDPSKTLHQQAAGSYLPGENCDITSPDSLTNFLNWAAKACPAKSYVLVFSDHGGGYSPDGELDNEASTRGIIYDHGHESKHFTAKSLASAIKASDIRPKIIYFDACLMNMLEYQFELKDLADYIVASTYRVPSLGGAYDALLECLSGASENVEHALEKYIEYAAKRWDSTDESTPSYEDLTVTATANLDKLGQTMREFTDRLCDTYKNGTAEQRQKIDSVTKNAVKVDNNNPYYDVDKYITTIMRTLPEVFGEDFSNQMKNAFSACVVGRYTSKYLLNHDYQVNYSVLLASKGTYHYTWWESKPTGSGKELTFVNYLQAVRYYHSDGTTTTYKVKGNYDGQHASDYTLEFHDKSTWGGTLESTYCQMAFDRAVGWSRWLLLNEQEPAIWSRSAFSIGLPDDNPDSSI